MDECEIFGSEFCRNGQCLNTVPGYKCFCRAGYFYDSSKLECVDQDECQNEVYCINGECLNTDGSYHCFCSLPLVLDATGNRCVNLSNASEEYEIHLDVCWQTVADYICQDLLHGEQTTYTECCCRLGEAWGQNCALCPHRSSGEWGGMGKHPPAEVGAGWGASGHVLQGRPHMSAEECGILNGCENGRCVRVREGYTCDCFDGFQLDMTRMACMDIDECEEVGGPEPLCQGGTCKNTEGSYRCHCLPGYIALAQPHHCVPQTAQSPPAA
uniref:Latent transforming growth factor beta binding protein 2 n=1 Tax=Strigops habroptila TaxID=2489341 RepID=A0A672TLS2_STRHB